MTATVPSGRLQSVDLVPGLAVTVLGGGPAGATAGRVLQALGAQVSTIDASWRDVDTAGLDGDAVVVCDVVAEGAEADYLAAVAARRRGAWVTVSAFGLDGPLGGRPGSDLLCGAAGGLLGAVTDSHGGFQPLPGLQALGVGGQVAALAVLHAVSLVRGGQEPVHLDVAVQEAAAFCSVQQEAAHKLFECGGAAGASRYSAPSGYFPCIDGEILITVLDDHQMVRFAEVIDRPDWPEKYPRITDRAAHGDEIDAVVQAWTSTRSKFECERLLQGNGVAATAVRSIAEAASNEQYRARDFLLPAGDDKDTRLSFGALPTLVQPASGGEDAADGDGRRPSDPGARTLSGLRVAEITNVLAGPLAGAIIGAMGATVVRLEDEQRLDIYRRNGPFEFGRPDRERAAYFLFANYNKRSVYRHVDGSSSFPRSVVAWADMVLENVGSRRLDRLGLGGSDDPRMMVSISGFGRTGPCADYKAYAPNVHSFAGLSGATRELSQSDATIRTSFADYSVAVWAATLAAAWWLGGSHPLLFDLSMSEVIAAKLHGLPFDVGDAGTITDLVDTPGMILRCTDGGVALALGAASEADVFAAVGVDAARAEVTRSPLTVSADLTSAGSSVAGVQEGLARAGFNAHEVLPVAELVVDPHLEARGFLLPLEHPGGAMKIFSLPWKVAGTRRDGADGWYRRSPLLGEDDDWMDEQLQAAAVGPVDDTPR
jgi:crotonobetainyl-CoA:carnitine CoA-transferase CaiB-like acyl-CoA transferase